MGNETSRSINPKFRWVMLALVWLVYFVFIMNFYSINSLITPIGNDLILTGTQTGLILGTVSLVYIPLSIPIGFLIDRVGIKKSIMTGIAIVSFAGILRVFATNFETLFISVFMFGFGAPIISIGAPKVVASWFSSKERGIATGIYLTGAFIGYAVTFTITHTLIVPLVGNWRNTLLLYGLLGFLMTFVWILSGRESEHAQTGGITTAQLRKAIGILLKEKYVWIIAIICLFSIGFANQGFASWLQKLLELKGMSSSEAGFLTSIPAWCGLIGGIIIPGLAKAGSRKPIVFVTLLVQGICVFIVGTTSGLTLIASLILYGISVSAMMPLLLVILMDMPQVGPEYMSIAAGILFSFLFAGGFIGSFMIGFLMDLTGSTLLSIIVLTIAVEAMLIPALLIKEKRSTQS